MPTNAKPQRAAHSLSPALNGLVIMMRRALPHILPSVFLNDRRPQCEIDSPAHNLYNVTLMIGEFEYLLIAASHRLGEDAYGASIRREVEEATERPCSIGSLYTTLDRLEAKGLVRTWMGEATSQRGGRAKRMVSVTAKGAEAASAFYRAISRVSRDISWEALCPLSQE